MASIESPIDDGIVEPGIEPGASTETMLVTTDSFDEYEQELSNSLDDRQMKESTNSIPEITEDKPASFSPSEIHSNFKQNNSLEDADLEETTDQMAHAVLDVDPLRCKHWLAQKKHIFVLSQAGKPCSSL